MRLTKRALRRRVTVPHAFFGSHIVAAKALLAMRVNGDGHATRAYLGQVLVRQQVQLSWFEAILAFTFVEEVRLEFPAGVFLGGRHAVRPLVKRR